jgi:transglutaminase-like putative cysteine protease
VSYAVTLEPHRQRWLFALDRPFKSSRRTRIFSDGTLRTWRKVNALFHYEVVSYSHYNTGAFQPEDWVTLDLPLEGNPRSRELAERWAAEASGPTDIINKALNFLRGNQFSYTLQAPLAGPDTIDDFLFKTRKGYCEHYASAFAFLMRAADVPARIVGGYLGGEKNPYADYLIVRQADAHAWVEVWLPENGWTRIDPTSVVAPARVSQGMAAALASEEREILEQAYSYLGPLAAPWRKLQFGWDLANNHWNQWVIIYSLSQQRDFFTGLGFPATGWRTPAVGLAAALGIIGLYFGGLVLISRWRRQRRPAQTTDEAHRVYLDFCQRMAAAGLPRAPFLGPRDYARGVMAARPDLAPEIRSIIDLYVKIRYSREGEKGHLQALKSNVKGFHPPKSAPNA